MNDTSNDTSNDTQFVTRFAPSPTGYLHKGHAYSALLAYRAAKAANGRFILRIEDIDTGRCKPDFIDAIYEDLAWLGITWETPVRIQSEHFSDYQTALNALKDKDLAYPCFCTRKDIQAEIAKANSAPHGPDGPLYPRICAHLPADERSKRLENGEAHAWRLDIEKALAETGPLPPWHDAYAGAQQTHPRQLGDIVLARKDTPTSYHLSVVIDDSLQSITHIIRGTDLMHATHMHVLLQKLLSLPTPTYEHHALLTDDAGVRYAKRSKAATLKSLRESGIAPTDLIASLFKS